MIEEPSRRPREAQFGEHDYARTPGYTWPGEVIMSDGTGTQIVHGSWTLEFHQRAPTRVGAAALVPPIGDAVAWTARVARVMRLQEPGLQLGVGATNASGWRTLRVTAPSSPLTVIEFDRDAMARIAGVQSITLRVRI